MADMLLIAAFLLLAAVYAVDCVRRRECERELAAFEKKLEEKQQVPSERGEKLQLSMDEGFENIMSYSIHGKSGLEDEA